jgi:anti-sigma regulatory factor (Ser/Thr protein kinase)
VEWRASAVSVEFPADVAAPRAVRIAVRDALAGSQLDAALDVAELLVDELVSNVVRHVGSPGQVRIVRRPSSIRFEIDDASTDLPVRRDPDPWADHGRGIVLVESLASAWGVDVRERGKTVWFELETEVSEG